MRRKEVIKYEEPNMEIMLLSMSDDIVANLSTGDSDRNDSGWAP